MIISSSKDYPYTSLSPKKEVSTFTSLLENSLSTFTPLTSNNIMRSSNTIQWFRKRHQKKTKQQYLFKAEELVKDVEIEEAFRFCPKQDPSKISISELQYYFKIFGMEVDSDDLQIYFQEIDKDRDMGVSLSELKNAASNRRANELFSKMMLKVRASEWKVIDRELDLIRAEIQEKQEKDVPVNDLVDYKNKLEQKRFKTPVSFSKMITYLNFLRSRADIDAEFQNRPVGLCENLEKIKKLLSLTGQINQASLCQINFKKKKDWMQRSNSLLMLSQNMTISIEQYQKQQLLQQQQQMLDKEDFQTMNSFRNDVGNIVNEAKMAGIEQAQNLYMSMSQPSLKFKKMEGEVNNIFNNIAISKNKILNSNYYAQINNNKNNNNNDALNSNSKISKNQSNDNLQANRKYYYFNDNINQSSDLQQKELKTSVSYMKLKNQLKNTFNNEIKLKTTHLIEDILKKEMPKELQEIDKKIKNSIMQKADSLKFSYDQSIAKKNNIQQLKIELNQINDQLKSKYNIKDNQLKYYDLSTKQDDVLKNAIQTLKPDFSCILSPISQQQDKTDLKEVDQSQKYKKFKLMQKRPRKKNRLNFQQIKQQLFIPKVYNNNINNNSQQSIEQVENYSIPISLLPTLSQFSFVNANKNISQTVTQLSFKQSNADSNMKSKQQNDKQERIQNFKQKFIHPPQKIETPQKIEQKPKTQKSFYDTSTSQIQQNNTCESTNPFQNNAIYEQLQKKTNLITSTKEDEFDNIDNL